MSDHIKEAIIEYWGERCNGYSEGCPVCAAWQELDALEAENAKLRQQVELAQNNTQVTYEEMWDKYRCEFCGAVHKRERELVHHSDCPHAEASK